MLPVAGPLPGGTQVIFNRLATSAFIALPVLLGAPSVPSAGNGEETANCALRQQIVKLLADGYRQKQQGVGLISEKAIVELFISGEGNWTLIVSDVEGVSCVIGLGAEWQASPTLAGQLS